MRGREELRDHATDARRSAVQDVLSFLQADEILAVAALRARWEGVWTASLVFIMFNSNASPKSEAMILLAQRISEMP